MSKSRLFKEPNRMMPLFGFGAMLVISATKNIEDEKKPVAMSMEIKSENDSETFHSITLWIKAQEQSSKEAGIQDLAKKYYKMLEEKVNNSVENFKKSQPLNSEIPTLMQMRNVEYAEFIRGEWLDIRQICYIEQMQLTDSGKENSSEVAFLKELRAKVEKVHYLHITKPIITLNEDNETVSRTITKTGYLPPLEVLPRKKP